MAWTNLPTNYTDASWSGNRKYQQITNSDGTVSFVDKTVYTNKENSFFGAKDANQTNDGINQAMAQVAAEATTRASADNAINTKLDPIKTLIDTVFLGEIVKNNDRGVENNKYKPVYFGTVTYGSVGLGTAGNGNTTWHKEAVKVLYTRLKDKGYKGICLVWGVFQPAMYQWVIGSVLISTDGTYSEDASGYPSYCQFISLTYGGNTMYRFGMNDGTWYFETIPTTTQVNTLINNAKTALTTKIETNIPKNNLFRLGFIYTGHVDKGGSAYTTNALKRGAIDIGEWFTDYVRENYSDLIYSGTNYYINYGFEFYGYGSNHPFNRFHVNYIPWSVGPVGSQRYYSLTLSTLGKTIWLWSHDGSDRFAATKLDYYTGEIKLL